MPPANCPGLATLLRAPLLHTFHCFLPHVPMESWRLTNACLQEGGSHLRGLEPQASAEGRRPEHPAARGSSRAGGKRVHAAKARAAGRAPLSQARHVKFQM